jgi:hypothetical protein
MKVGANVIFRVEKLGKLPDGKAIADGKRKISDEICFIGIEERTFDDIAGDGIGAVEDEEDDVALGGFFHAVRHRGGVGIEANTRVLNIEHQSIDTLEHVVGGAERFAVQAVSRKTRGTVARRGNLFVEVTGEAVLGAEERDEVHAGRVRKEIDRGAALRIEASVIGDETDVLSP